MLLNRFEAAMMNNPIRAALQRRFEARRLLAMGGSVSGSAALEMGCDRGVGVELILDVFGAGSVDAFDLDPRMLAHAHRRLRGRDPRVRLWQGDATSIAVADDSYDAVFDFGIIHHVPNWRDALAEVRRVLKPGGRFFAEEVFARFISNPVWSRLLEHPRRDRFDHDDFRGAMLRAGLTPLDSKQLWGDFGWFIADKPAAV